jgi:hypothetical protein
MHSDGVNSADAYKVRLCEILELENSTQLQSLFQGGDLLNPLQEQIWYDAKAFLESEYHLTQKSQASHCFLMVFVTCRHAS